MPGHGRARFQTIEHESNVSYRSHQIRSIHTSNILASTRAFPIFSIQKNIKIMKRRRINNSFKINT